MKSEWRMLPLLWDQLNTWIELNLEDSPNKQSPNIMYATKTGKNDMIAIVIGTMEDSKTLTIRCICGTYSKYFVTENQAKKQPKPIHLKKLLTN